MAEPSKTVPRRVLHVRPPSSAGSAEIAGAIAEADCQAVPCPDVYRAMARLCSARNNRFCAVVVCVDRMESAEFEFFQLAATHYRDTPVYVFGSGQAQPKIESALRLGARQVLDAADLANVLKPAPAPEPFPQVEPEPDQAEETRAAQPEPDQAEETRAAQPEPPPVVGGTGENGKSTQEEGPTELEPKGRKKRDRTARVPWLRYDDLPQRAPPKRDEPAEGKPESTPDEPQGPLLTQEELDALLGDPKQDDPPKRQPKQRGSL